MASRRQSCRQFSIPSSFFLHFYRRYMAEILPIQHKTLYNQSINLTSLKRDSMEDHEVWLSQVQMKT